MIINTAAAIITGITGYLGYKSRKPLKNDLEKYGHILGITIILLPLAISAYYAYINPGTIVYLIAGAMIFGAYTIISKKTITLLLAPISFLAPELIAFTTSMSYLLLLKEQFHEFLLTYTTTLLLLAIISLFTTGLTALIPYCLGGISGSVIVNEIIHKSKARK